MRNRFRLCALLLTSLVLILLLLSGCSAKENVLPPVPVQPGENGSDVTLTPSTDPASIPPETETNAPTEEIPSSEDPVLSEPDPVTETTPAPATEPPETDPPYRPNLTEQFTKDDWRRINTFLSNFSEIWFDNYASDESGEEFDLLNYGYLHLKINDNAKVHYDSGYYYVTKADMDKCLNRFFGRTVPAGEYTRSSYGYTETISYRNDAFQYPAADGEAYNYLTIVYQMQETDHQTYYVAFDVFELDIEEYFDRGISDSYYAMNYSEAVSSSQLTYVYSGTAEIRDYENGTLKSYQLISYSIN